MLPTACLALRSFSPSVCTCFSLETEKKTKDLFALSLAWEERADGEKNENEENNKEDEEDEEKKKKKNTQSV